MGPGARQILTAQETNLFEEGRRKSVDLLQRCATDDGFFASVNHTANYNRVWGRDGVIMTLAALLTREDDLIRAARRTLHSSEPIDHTRR